ncbi:MAG: MFS transporter [marine bacterium B5-7]|nr:MAG: MFS transporter [marine bacterium B5-7]
MHWTLGLRILVPFGLGYFLSYLFRVVNAVIASDMSSDLDLHADTLGLLTSIYFLTFAAFQLPLGVLLDRYGSRRVEAILLVIAASGAMIFASADSATGLMVGRALIGLGVSSCLMAAFTAYRHWFEPTRLPFVNGLQMTFGGMGALAGTRPVAMLLEIGSWRDLFFGLSGLTILVAFLIWFVVPRRHDAPTVTTTSKSGFGNIFKSVEFWKIAPLAVASQAAFLSLQGLWIGTWLRDVAELDLIHASNIMALTTMAMVAGFLTIGWFSSRMSKRGVDISLTAVTGMGLFLVPQAIILAGGLSVPAIAWGFFGFFGTSSIIAYASLARHFPIQLSGRVNTSLNFLVFVSAFALQWGFGVVINQFPASHGYQPIGYQVAISILFALQVSGLIGYFLIGRRR